MSALKQRPEDTKDIEDELIDQTLNAIRRVMLEENIGFRELAARLNMQENNLREMWRLRKNLTLRMIARILMKMGKRAVVLTEDEL